VNASALRKLLGKLQDGTLTVDEVTDSLQMLPYESVGDMALVDHHRELRIGAPEIVYGESKSAEQIAKILQALNRDGAGAFASRVSEAKAKVVRESVPEAQYHPLARCLVVAPSQERTAGVGRVGVLCAGTSDLPVAEEAVLCLEFLGQETTLIADVGVSGLHRLLDRVPQLAEFQVLVVVAGMEGALPTVVAGLVGRPIIALPTSVGYGVSLGGFAALASMLSSCAPGVSVVNIDNGIGAAMAAARINQRPRER
jgi:NCAIR mutase (PurE)-related protein